MESVTEDHREVALNLCKAESLVCPQVPALAWQVRSMAEGYLHTGSWSDVTFICLSHWIYAVSQKNQQQSKHRDSQILPCPPAIAQHQGLCGIIGGYMRALGERMGLLFLSLQDSHQQNVLGASFSGCHPTLKSHI